MSYGGVNSQYFVEQANVVKVTEEAMLELIRRDVKEYGVMSAMAQDRKNGKG